MLNLLHLGFLCDSVNIFFQFSCVWHELSGTEIFHIRGELNRKIYHLCSIFPSSQHSVCLFLLRAIFVFVISHLFYFTACSGSALFRVWMQQHGLHFLISVWFYFAHPHAFSVLLLLGFPYPQMHRLWQPLMSSIVRAR